MLNGRVVSVEGFGPFRRPARMLYSLIWLTSGGEVIGQRFNVVWAQGLDDVSSAMVQALAAQTAQTLAQGEGDEGMGKVVCHPPGARRLPNQLRAFGPLQRGDEGLFILLARIVQGLKVKLAPEDGSQP